MLPSVWGKHGWNFLHLTLLSYPKNPTDEDKQNYKEYITSLQKVLPCNKCRNHMKAHLQKHPLDDAALSSRDSIVKWGIDLHNIVNYHTGKRMLTYSEAINEINKLAKVKDQEKPFLLFVVMLMVVIMMLLTYQYVKRNW